MGLRLFFMLILIARGSLSQPGSGEDSGPSDDLQPGSDENCTRACPLRPTFPFFRDSLEPPSDAHDHPYLRLQISRKHQEEEEEEEVPHLRIFIWPNSNTGNCSISGQLTNGAMRKKATFIVETARYTEGLCVTATTEVDPRGNQSVWTLPHDKLRIDSFNTTYEVILEGNGTTTEWHEATWLVVVVYIVFCAVFFLLWWLLVYPGTCL